jgi:Tfp pilus assembly protein PilX
MHVPPSSHFIFIPVVLVLGVVLGFILGARATRDALTVERRRQADREARRAARAAESGIAESGGPPPTAR